MKKKVDVLIELSLLCMKLFNLHLLLISARYRKLDFELEENVFEEVGFVCLMPLQLRI